MGLNPEIEKQVSMAIDVLKQGGVVVFPTDTVYGVGAAANNDEALKTIFEIKGRPRAKPLQVFLSRIEDIDLVARQTPEAARRVAEALLPGGLTLILRKQAWLSDVITAGGDTVAVRIPAHPVPIALVNGLGVPLAATSANLSGQPAATTAEEARRQLGDLVPLIVDAGTSPEATESTILDLATDPPRILRPGAVSREAIEAALGGKVEAADWSAWPSGRATERHG